MTGLYHGWDGDKDNHADFRHGGVDPKDFEEPTPYKKKRVKKRPKKRGCPGNDGKAHVYIWVTEIRERKIWAWHHMMDPSIDPRTYTVELKRCCGCEKIVKRKFNWDTYYG